MRCPKCGYIEDRVIDSRSSKDGASIRRRRECTECLHRFTTYEQIERAEIRVVKREACEQRPVSREAIEIAVEEIASDLEANFGREVPSNLIGGKVMEKLHALDEVAYVRYASVYRHFADIGEFLHEIQNLERKVKPSALQTELFK